MTRWEYKIESVPTKPGEEVPREELLAKLNELGKEGWRLIAIDPRQHEHVGYGTAEALPLFLMREVTA